MGQHIYIVDFHWTVDLGSKQMGGSNVITDRIGFFERSDQERITDLERWYRFWVCFEDFGYLPEWPRSVIKVLDNTSETFVVDGSNSGSNLPV